MSELNTKKTTKNDVQHEDQPIAKKETKAKSTGSAAASKASKVKDQTQEITETTSSKTIKVAKTAKTTKAKKVEEVAEVAEVAKISEVKKTTADEKNAAAPILKEQPKEKAATQPSAKSIDSSELTEQALLAMSDDDYMNQAQLTFFKKRLQKIRHDILENADQTTENLRETVYVPDPVDRASIEEEHALELRTRDRERKLLAKIEQSLKKIEDGSYGWCDETGEPIGVPRLLARPTANLCLEAQERRELRQKMFGE